MQGELAKWPSHSRTNSRLDNAVRIQGSSPCIGNGFDIPHILYLALNCSAVTTKTLVCPSQATDKGLRINKDKRLWTNGYGIPGCRPKIEPVEPASEPFLPHLLYTHVILKTQLGYTLIIDPWLRLLVLLDPKIANSDYLVNGCRESQPNGQAIQETIQGSIMR